MRVAVVGHVEWVEFVRVERLPRSGHIAHATEAWDEAAGGGAVAAVQLMKLAGAATLFTALGRDPLGRRSAARLRELGLRVEAAFRPEPQRRAMTFVDARGERTITTIGRRLDPRGADRLAWAELAEADAVYFTAGDRRALRAARRARVLVATARAIPDLIGTGVRLDALVGSGVDEGERYRPGLLEPAPALVVRTFGARGGVYRVGGRRPVRFDPAPVPGEVRDAYGCGDSFAAGLAFGLGAGMPAADAVDLAARCGAHCLAGRGPYEGQLRSSGTRSPGASARPRSTRAGRRPPP